jgi:hypothetical protein
MGGGFVKNPNKLPKIRDVLSNALGEIIGSGSKELGEALADRVRYFRWRSAVSIMEKAKKFAKERGVKARHIPLGFLIPFIEQSSLIDEESELSEMWANLLVSSMSEYSAEMIAFTKMLSELTPRGAKILRYLMNQEKGQYSRLVHPETTTTRHIKEVIEDEFDPHDVEGSGQRVVGALTMNGFSLMVLNVEVGGESSDFVTEFELEVNSNDNSLDLLKRQGLIEIINIDWIEVDGYAYSAVSALVTPLGLSFYCDCAGVRKTWEPDAKKEKVRSKKPKRSPSSKAQRNKTKRSKNVDGKKMNR